jgi:hypothetical protein
MTSARAFVKEVKSHAMECAHIKAQPPGPAASPYPPMPPKPTAPAAPQPKFLPDIPSFAKRAKVRLLSLLLSPCLP